MSESKQTEQISRRDFLKQGTSFVAGATAVASMAAPALVSAQNVNSQLNLGFLGTGSRACEILRSIADVKELRVTDICDIYPPHLAEGKKYSNNDKVRTYEVWQELIVQPDVDAVVVATPLFLHVPMSMASMQTGKHVFSEKSMGLTLKQLNQMVDTVNRHEKQTYMVGYNGRLNEGVAETKKLIEEGTIGEVTQFYVHFDRNETWKRDDVPPEWERVLNWRLYKEYCGGLLTEVVTHEIDQIIYILDIMPKSASFYGQIKVYKDGREHHDSIMGAFEMENGVLGLGSAHLANSSQGVGWSILGTHGTIETSGGGIRIFWEKEARHLDTFGVKHKFTNIKLGQSLKAPEGRMETPAKVLKFDIDGDYDLSTTREFRYFYDCVLNGKKPLNDAESCRKSSIAALMAYESSMQGGRTITREEFEAAG